MPGSPVAIGPFTGGLNTYSDPSAIADNECSYINNFDIDLDGTLVSRPPFSKKDTTSNPTGSGLRILGTFKPADGTDVYLICNTGTTTRAYNTTSGAWLDITTAFGASCFVQYANKAWIIANIGSAGTGGSWDPSTGFTAVAAIPKGVSAAVYKERLFVGTGSGTNPSRMNFSSPADFTKWNVSDFIDVNNGDGQAIKRIYNFSGSIVVFKADSTYIFAYDSAPTKGAVQVISATVGMENADCLAEYNGDLYVLHNQSMYSVTNWKWELLNSKVPFQYNKINTSVTWDQTLSVLGDRLIARYYNNYYIYGLKTRTWSLWTTSYTPGFFIKHPDREATTGLDVYYGGSFSASSYLYTFMDTFVPPVAGAETFTAEITTKHYNFEVPYSFKRMFWWGIDLLAKAKVDVNVLPVTYQRPVKWSQVATYTWADLANATWGRPLDIPINVTDHADIGNYTDQRMFVKFLKSLRFRQISFNVKSTLDGSNNTGPLRIFSLTAFVSNKQLVSQKIN